MYKNRPPRSRAFTIFSLILVGIIIISMIVSSVASLATPR
jgi:hypothetical protein